MALYTAGIRLVLIDQVSQGIRYVAGNISTANKELAAFKNNLLLSRNMLIGGGLLIGGGMFGFRMIKEALGPASEYVHLLNQANAIGLTHKQITEGIGAAWQTTSKSMSVSANEALKGFLDLKMVLGDVKSAVTALPILGEMKPLMGMAYSSAGRSFSSAEVNEQLYSMFKSLEMLGKTTSPVELRKDIGMMLKDIVFTQMRVTPEMFRMTAKYMRISGYTASDRFLFQELPFLIQEYAGVTGKGGGGAQAGKGGPGAMIMAAYRQASEGIVSQRQINFMRKIGFIAPQAAMPLSHAQWASYYSYQLRHGGALPLGAAAPVTSAGTYSPIPGAAIAYKDPLKWITDFFDPFAKKMKWSRDQAVDALGKIWGTLAAPLFATFYTRQAIFLKQIQGLNRMPTIAAMLKIASTDPNVAGMMMTAQWQNVLTAGGVPAMATVIPLMQDFAKGLNAVSKVFLADPELGSTIVKFGIALSAFATIAGIAFIAFSPLGAAVLGAAAAFTYAAKEIDKVRNFIYGTAVPYLVAHPHLGRAFVATVQGGKALGHGIEEAITFPVKVPYYGYEAFKSLFHHNVRGYATPTKSEHQQNLTVVMDKQKVGEIVTHHQATQMSKYGTMNNTGSKFNTRMNIPSNRYRYTK